MENAQSSQRKPPLPTNRITELEFRRIAGLCLQCGVARATNDDICDVCENIQLNRLNRYLDRNRRRRRAA